MWSAARADMRVNLRGALLMAIALMVAGGASLAALAGARRTDTAVERAFDHFAVSDVDIDLSPDPQTGDNSYGDAAFDAITAIDGVRAWTRVSYLLLTPKGFDLSSGPPTILPLVALDDSFGRDIGRFELLTGRLADSTAVDEIVVNRTFQQVNDVGPGDTYTVVGWRRGDMTALLSGAAPIEPRVEHTFRITGVVRAASELADPATEMLFPTPAFYDRVGREMAQFGPTLMVDVSDDGVLDDVRAAVAEAGGTLERVENPREEADSLDRTARVEALALLGFAVLAGAFGAVVVGQTIARQSATSVASAGAMHQLGATRRQLVVVLLAKVVLTAIVASAAAAVVAYAASSRFPVAVVRPFEPTPGRALDPLALGVGVLAFVATTIAASIPGTRRAVRAATRSDQPSEPPRRSAIRLAVAQRTSPPVASGLALALDRGRGDARTPVRSVVLVGVAAVAAILGCALFANTARDVAAEPERFGWTFDLVVGSEDTGDLRDRFEPELRSAPWVSAWSSAAVTDVVVDGVSVPLFGFEDGEGSVRPPVSEGRPPATATEIALGRRDLAAIGATIGDSISVDAAAGVRTLTIVGISVLPDSISAAGGLGHGGFTSQAGVRALDPDAPVNLFYVQFVPGTSTEDVLRELGPAAAEAATPDPGDSIRDVRRVASIPLALAAIVALVGVASVAHFLLASTRRRRVDLAVLRTLGFDARQVLGTVMTQATVVCGVAVIVGIPIGLVAGRYAWSLVAAGLGVGEQVTVPVGALTATAAVGPAIGIVLALAAGSVALRRRLADVLRVE